MVQTMLSISLAPWTRPDRIEFSPTKRAGEGQAGVKYSNEDRAPISLAGESVENLVERVRRADAAALGELYDRYSGRVFAFLLRAVERQLAEELLQDVFLATLQIANLFR